MKEIIIASTNPVKTQATLNGFRRMFPEEEFSIEQVSVPSGVSSQPRSDQETITGSLNRANRAAQGNPAADYWVGIEGGIDEWGEEIVAFAWVVVKGPNLTGKGRTGTFYLPKEVSHLIRQGKELGEADDIVFNRINSKRENGAVGILTGNAIDRAKLYEEAVILALIPFKNPGLYGS
jgi:inosine/xanthosine triphosphatase